MSHSQIEQRGGDEPAAENNLFTDFDHVAELCMEPDPLPRLQAMREACPVGRTEAHGGSWVLTRYRDIFNVARDPATFCSGKGVSFPAHGMPPLPPIETDPPVHGLFRGPLTPRFTPRAMAKNEDHAREVVTELIDAFIETGRADLAQQLTVPLPALVNTPVLGIPFADRGKFQDWAVRLLSSGGQDVEAIMNVAAYFTELYQLRKVEPGDDIPSLVLDVELDGAPLSAETFVLVMAMLMSAGLDTTTNAGSHILYWLGRHPAQRQELIDDTSRISLAVEELLRHITPLPTLFRTATTTTTVHGQEIPEGDRVQLSWMAGNHDPEEFDDPETVRLDRFPNRHFSFGVGAHRCLGAALARLELRVLLEETLPRLGDYQIAEEPTRYSGVTRGIHHLHVTFPPGPRVGGP